MARAASRIAMAFTRDHSSVIHACNAVERRRRLDGAFARMLDAIASELYADGDATGQAERTSTQLAARACATDLINPRFPLTAFRVQVAPSLRPTDDAARATKN
jgi:hypothetical protein